MTTTRANPLIIAAALDRLDAVQRCLSSHAHAFVASSHAFVEEAFAAACVHGSASVVEFLSQHYLERISVEKRIINAQAVASTLMYPIENREGILRLLGCFDDAFSADDLIMFTARMSIDVLAKILTQLQCYGLLRVRTSDGVLILLSELLSGAVVTSEALEMAISLIDSYPDSWNCIFCGNVTVRKEACPLICELWCQRNGFPFTVSLNKMTVEAIHYALCRNIHLWEDGFISGKPAAELNSFLQLVDRVLPLIFRYSPSSKQQSEMAAQIFNHLLRQAPLHVWSSSQLWVMLVAKDGVSFLSQLIQKYHDFLCSAAAILDHALAHTLQQTLHSLHSDSRYRRAASQMLFYEQKQPLVFDSSLAITTAEATRCVVLGHFLHSSGQSVSLAAKLAGLWSQEAFQVQFCEETQCYGPILTSVMYANDPALVDVFADLLLGKGDAYMASVAATAAYGLLSLPLSTQLLRRLPAPILLRSGGAQYFMENIIYNVIDQKQLIAALCENVKLSLLVDCQQYSADGLKAREELEDYVFTALAAGEAAFSKPAMQSAFVDTILEQTQTTFVATLLAELRLPVLQELVGRGYMTVELIQRCMSHSALSLLCRRGRLDTVRYLVEDLDLGAAIDGVMWDSNSFPRTFVFMLARQRKDEPGEALYQYLRNRALLYYEYTL